MSWFLFLATVTSVACQELHQSYNLSSIELSGVGFCPSTEKLREEIKEDIELVINNSVPYILTMDRACGCGGPGWRRTAYLNMSDPTQTCPRAWELITTPKRSCARPSSASYNSCYSAIFPIQGIQYSQVCGRIIGYQVGEPEAFIDSGGRTIDDYYVDGVSLTYGSRRQHIWTFANALDEYPSHYVSICPCTKFNEQYTINIPSYVGNDYFCETGVPPGQRFERTTFHADDPLWDGQGCGPNSTCCTFNNPPWFCKQLPQSTNVDLEVRLCSRNPPSTENTPIELIEIYVK